MGRIKRIIPTEKYNKLENDIHLYMNYLKSFVNKIGIDDKDDRDKQRMKYIIEYLFTLDIEDQYLIIALYLCYNKKIRIMFTDLNLKEYVNFHSLCNNVSKIKTSAKEYADNRLYNYNNNCCVHC